MFYTPIHMQADIVTSKERQLTASNNNMMTKLSLTLLVLLSLPCSVQGRQRLPFQYIDGAICVPATLQNGPATLKANLMVDFGLNCDLLIHADAQEVLALDSDQPITVDLKGRSLEGVTVIAQSLDELDEFSKKNAVLLDEIPVWGILGITAFDSPVMMLDIQNRLCEYGDIEIPEGHQLSCDIVKGRWVGSIEPDPGYQVKVVAATGEYECVFDGDTAALAGSETADFENCRFFGLNLRDYTAIRAHEEFSSQLGVGDCVIANSFWQNFVVFWDIQNSQLTLLDHPGGMISDVAEQKCYNAFAEEDVEEIERYLENYPESRLVEEACRTLLEMAVESGDSQRIDAAVSRFCQGLKPKPAAEQMTAYAVQAIEDHNWSMAEQFLTTAGTQINKTEDAPLLAGRINAYSGWTALETQRLSDARRYLLNALFVNPQDTLTNYLMGRYHQSNDEWTRAWARYLRASLTDDPSEPAILALKQMDQNTAFRTAFTVEDACDFLEGHLHDEEGKLSQPAMLLRLQGGELIQSAIDRIQEQRQ